MDYTSCKLQATSHKPQVTSYELRVTSRRPRYEKVSAVICVLMLLSAVICVSAFATYEEKIKEYEEEIQEKKREKGGVKRELITKKKELEKKRQKEQNLRQRLSKIKKDLKKRKKEITTYDENLKKTKEKLEKKRKDLEGATAELKTSRNTLKERLVIIYKRKSPSYPHNFPKKVLQKKSMNIIASCNALELSKDEEKKGEIERERGALRERKKRITTYKKAALIKKSEIERDRKAKERLLAKTKKKRIAYQKKVAELEKASKELEALIKNLETKKKETREQARLASLAFKEKRGRLPWPAMSHQVIKTYGKHQHPQYKTYTLHKGIDIKAPQGAEVYAVSGGIVRFAQWSQEPGLRSYGKMVMIAHGGGYYTLYAHLDRILVRKDQAVEGGQMIGKVGETASEKGAYLYFEIRKDGAPLNPLGWLRK